MQSIPVDLPVGPGYQMVSRAWLDDNTVSGELDFPPPLPLSFGDHFPLPNRPILPGTQKLSLMSQVITAYCAAATEGKLYPVLTGIPLVQFNGLDKPGDIEIVAKVYQDGVVGIAICTLGANGKIHAWAVFTFELNAEGPREVLLPLPLENVAIEPNVFEGTISATFKYRGDEILPLDKLSEIPWSLVLEALGQNAILIRHGHPGFARSLFVVTYLRKVVFRNRASLGVLGLRTELVWTPGQKRGLVHAAASSGEELVVDGDFGFAVLSPVRSK